MFEEYGDNMKKNIILQRKYGNKEPEAKEEVLKEMIYETKAYIKKYGFKRHKLKNLDSILME